MAHFEPSMWNENFHGQNMSCSQDTLFDPDEFLMYDDEQISPEEALPTIEKEGFNTTRQMSPPTPSTLIDDCYNNQFDVSFSFGDFPFPCPPMDYSSMPMFQSGYASIPNALQYRSMASSMTPAHSRQSSHGSFGEEAFYDSPSPRLQNEPVTPIESPEVRFLGERTLLPKVRPQDQAVKAPTQVQQRSQSVKARPSGPTGIVRRSQKMRAGHSRSVSFDNLSAHLIGNDPAPKTEVTLMPMRKTRPVSCFASPISRTKDAHSHQRRHSTQTTDMDTLLRYSRPTYRTIPAPYMSMTASLDMQSSPAATLSFSGPETYALSTSASAYETSQASISRQSSPLRQQSLVPQSQPSYSYAVQTEDSVPQTTLAAYLTCRNPSPNLCTEVDTYQRIDKSSMWWWWDIRQVRPWASFSLPSIMGRSAMHTALSSSLPQSALVSTSSATVSNPKTLQALKSTLGSFIVPRLNSALHNFPSSDSKPHQPLVMRFGDGVKEADFISAYANSPSQPHVVGLLRNWHHWNSGLLSSREPQRAAYCRGLAELQGRMREAGTRYGFLINETEICVVRNGTDEIPDFGFVEVANFALSTFIPESDMDSSAEPSKMTAMLALFHLHILASPSMQPENEPNFRTHIGAPVEMTRSKVLRDENGDEVEKDNWIPEIKAVMDGRPAKNSRGWVWPGDVLSSREKRRMKGVKWGNYRGNGLDGR